MMGVLMFAVVLASATVDRVQQGVMINAPVSAMADDAAAAPQFAQARASSGLDPNQPPKEWLTKMVRPCTRTGSRLVC